MEIKNLCRKVLTVETSKTKAALRFNVKYFFKKV